MDLLFVAGHINEMLYSKITYKKSIINRHTIFTSALMDAIKDKQLKIDRIVIFDEGIDETLEELEKNITGVRKLYLQTSIIFITRNLELKQKFKDYTVCFQENIRLTISDYEVILKQIVKGENNKVIEEEQINTSQTSVVNEATEVKKEKMSLFSKFKRSKVNEEIQEDNKFKYISKGISRIIAVTGHRGAGLTSTVVNLGYEAAKRNLNTIIIDLDVANRTTNLYFSEFIRQVEMDEHLAASFIKCLAKPQDYQSNACNVKNKLWLTSLSYDFQDHKLLEQFYHANKLINMLTVFRQYFNVILLDLPLEVLSEFQECIPNIDTFALCVQNSQYSVITTLRNMDNYLHNSNIGYLNAKSKLVVTRYNDRAQYENDFFSPEKVSELFASDLCEELTIKMPVAGSIRYNESFDLQIENDIPITENNPEFKEYYSNILLRMLEGAN